MSGVSKQIEKEIESRERVRKHVKFRSRRLRIYKFAKWQFLLIPFNLYIFLKVSRYRISVFNVIFKVFVFAYNNSRDREKAYRWMSTMMIAYNGVFLRLILETGIPLSINTKCIIFMKLYLVIYFYTYFFKLEAIISR